MKTVSPSPSVITLTLRLPESIVTLFNEAVESVGELATTTSAKLHRLRLQKPSWKRSGPKILLLGLSVVVLLIAWKVFASVNRPQGSNTQPTVPSPRATMTIGHDFVFPLNDDKGKEISKITIGITTADVRDEIIVKGQRATAIEGKTFLIIEMKIVNQYSKAIDINTKDYVRLTVNGKTNELLAPDIHNDPVNVQAVSTKYTRLGFAVNVTDRNFVLNVGELNGPKTPIPLNLKIK